MFEILDSLIATIAVVLILSLIVQGVEQIIKQILSVKSRYMERELFMLFRRQREPETRKTTWEFFLHRTAPIVVKISGRSMAGSNTRAALEYLKNVMASIGYNDLGLVEKLKKQEFEELVSGIVADLAGKDPAAEIRITNRLKRTVSDLMAEFISLKNSIGLWYDHTMRAFQDHYERRMKMWSYALGALVVLSLNADIIAIHREFTANKVIRESAVRVAGRLAAQSLPAAGSGVSGDAARGTDDLTQIKRRLSQVDSLVADRSYAIMRWNSDRGDPFRWRDSTGVNLSLAWSDFRTGLARNWIGWLGMAILVGLGAPFWYDLLRLLVGVKGVVQKKGAANGSA